MVLARPRLRHGSRPRQAAQASHHRQSQRRAPENPPSRGGLMLKFAACSSFTLPCRGRVARRSEAQARRGGAVRQAPTSRKEGPHPGSLRSPTLPLQGRLKGVRLAPTNSPSTAKIFDDEGGVCVAPLAVGDDERRLGECPKRDCCLASSAPLSSSSARARSRRANCRKGPTATWSRA